MLLHLKLELILIKIEQDQHLTFDIIYIIINYLKKISENFNRKEK